MSEAKPTEGHDVRQTSSYPAEGIWRFKDANLWWEKLEEYAFDDSVPDAYVTAMEYNPWAAANAEQIWRKDTGGSYTWMHSATWDQAKMFAYLEFVVCVTRERCRWQDVHRAMLHVAEYIDGLSDDHPDVTPEMRRTVDKMRDAAK